MAAVQVDARLTGAAVDEYGAARGDSLFHWNRGEGRRWCIRGDWRVRRERGVGRRRGPGSAGVHVGSGVFVGKGVAVAVGGGVLVGGGVSVGAGVGVSVGSWAYTLGPYDNGHRNVPAATARTINNGTVTRLECKIHSFI